MKHIMDRRKAYREGVIKPRNNTPKPRIHETNNDGKEIYIATVDEQVAVDYITNRDNTFDMYILNTVQCKFGDAILAKLKPVIRKGLDAFYNLFDNRLQIDSKRVFADDRHVSYNTKDVDNPSEIIRAFIYEVKEKKIINMNVNVRCMLRDITTYDTYTQSVDGTLPRNRVECLKIVYDSNDDSIFYEFTENIIPIKISQHNTSYTLGDINKYIPLRRVSYVDKSLIDEHIYPCGGSNCDLLMFHDSDLIDLYSGRDIRYRSHKFETDRLNMYVLNDDIPRFGKDGFNFEGVTLTIYEPPIASNEKIKLPKYLFTIGSYNYGELKGLQTIHKGVL